MPGHAWGRRAGGAVRALLSTLETRSKGPVPYLLRLEAPGARVSGDPWEGQSSGPAQDGVASLGGGILTLFSSSLTAGRLLL